jgi:hypothetical protein
MTGGSLAAAAAVGATKIAKVSTNADRQSPDLMQPCSKHSSIFMIILILVFQISDSPPRKSGYRELSSWQDGRSSMQATNIEVRGNLDSSTKSSYKIRS